MSTRRRALLQAGDSPTPPKPYPRIEWLGMNFGTKQYIRLNAIPGFNGTRLNTNDIIKLKFTSIFQKPQNNRNFIASLGYDAYFHYTEIKDSKIGGSCLRKSSRFF